MSNQNSLNAETRPIDTVLNRTEVGHFLLTHKAQMIGVLIVSILYVFAHATYIILRNSNNKEMNSLMYRYEKELLTPYSEGKVDDLKFVQGVVKAFDDIGDYNGSVLFYAKTMDLALKVKEPTESLKKSVIGMWNTLSGNYAQELLFPRYIAFLDYIDATDEAKKVLKDAIFSSILLDRVYFELGRVHLSAGEKKEAQKSFEFLVKTYPDSPFTPLARFKLSNLGN